MSLTLSVPVKIMVRAKSAKSRLHKMARRFTADGIDPLEYRCLRCGCEWDDSPLQDYREVTCSNCYGERVLLTKVRLEFNDWGKQNGGKAEQKRRYDAAIAALGGAPWLT